MTLSVKIQRLLPGWPVAVMILFAVVTVLYSDAVAQDAARKPIERRLHDREEDKAAGPGPVGKGMPLSWQLFRADEYLALPDYEREFYVAGLSDAYNWSYSGGFKRMKWIVRCVQGRKAPQLTAMFGKWLKQNPERWHEPAAKLFPFAIFELCRKAQQPLGRESAAPDKNRK
jgi:hypothetical protein